MKKVYLLLMGLALLVGADNYSVLIPKDGKLVFHSTYGHREILSIDENTSSLEIKAISGDGVINSAQGIGGNYNDTTIATSEAIHDYVTSFVGGGSPVTSIFGRAGDVVATSGDYTSTQITNSSSVAGANTTLALDQLDADISQRALISNVLELDNTDVYIPTLDYHPSTKKYVDDSITVIGTIDTDTYVPTANCVNCTHVFQTVKHVKINNFVLVHGIASIQGVGGALPSLQIGLPFAADFVGTECSGVATSVWSGGELGQITTDTGTDTCVISLPILDGIYREYSFSFMYFIP